MENTYFELWDADSGNLVGCFADLPEAIAFLKEGVAEHGADVLAGYFLIGDAEDAEPIADEALLDLVTRSSIPSRIGV